MPIQLKATDGFPARDQGQWAREKLVFLEKYLPECLSATQSKPTRHYVDLFSGPGRNIFVDRKTGKNCGEYPGSPLIALGSSHTRPSGESVRFTHFHFCNYNRLDHAALEGRLATAASGDQTFPRDAEIHHDLGDANCEVNRIVERIGRWDYVFAFLDIEGPKDLFFETVRALARASRSVDLYILHPGLHRLFPYDRKKGEPHKKILDRYFGDFDWRDHWRERPTKAYARRMSRKLKDLYIQQLRTLWVSVEEIQKVRGPGGFSYRMLFATNHPVGDRISGNIASKQNPQGDLFR